MTVGPAHIPMLDRMRGLAALAVAWFHCTNTYGDSWATALGAYGWLGVEVFFVLSGFVIPYALLHATTGFSLRDYPLFMAKRLMRLEPPYLASIALVIGLWHLSAMVPGFKGAPPPEIDAAQIAAHALYAIPLTGHDWLQVVYWTLAYEFGFYLVIGLLFPIICGAERFPHAVAAAVALALLVAAGAVGPLSLLFVMGVAAFRHLAGQDGPARTLCLCLAAAGMMAAQDMLLQAAVGLGTTLAILLHDRVPTAPARLGALLTKLGLISYSLYLIHVPIGGRIVNLGRRFSDEPLFQLLLSLAALGVCLACAALFWRLFEKPAVDAARRLGRQPGRARPASA